LGSLVFSSFSFRSQNYPLAMSRTVNFGLVFNQKRKNIDALSTSKGKRTESHFSPEPERKKKKKGKRMCVDPSEEFLAAPTSTPTVRAFKEFFAGIAPHLKPPVVHVGPSNHWRTVAKLSVRSSFDNDLQIGLFAPGSHEVMEH
jgi:hypothetical protein